MADKKKSWKGLLDPVNRNSQLPPGNIPNPSRYLPTNTSVGSGYNTLAQVLAQGQSPGSPGTGPYYHRADFRAPSGQMSSMAKYAPANAMSPGARNGWDQSFWQNYLRSQGLGMEGNNQRIAGSVQPGTQPGTQPGSPPPQGLEGWLAWLRQNYPGLNFGNAP